MGLLSPERATPLMHALKQNAALSIEFACIQLRAALLPGGNKMATNVLLAVFPSTDAPETTPIPVDIIRFLETITTCPVDTAKVKLWIARDPVLS